MLIVSKKYRAPGNLKDDNIPELLMISIKANTDIFCRGTRAYHLTLCVCVVSGVWCPLDGCDAPIGQRGKTTVQS